MCPRNKKKKDKKWFYTCTVVMKACDNINTQVQIFIKHIIIEKWKTGEIKRYRNEKQIWGVKTLEEVDPVDNLTT